MGRTYGNPYFGKWAKSKRARRMRRPRNWRRGRGGTNGCLHKSAHKIHSGEYYCPRCKLVVGYDREDRPENRPKD